MELTHGLDNKQIVVDKVAKQVYMVDGHRLKLRYHGICHRIKFALCVKLLDFRLRYSYGDSLCFRFVFMFASGDGRYDNT